MLNPRTLYSLILASFVLAGPVSKDSFSSDHGSGTSTSWQSSSNTLSAPSEAQTVPPASDDPNFQIYPPGFDGTPKATRGPLGANILQKDNTAIDRQNPDILAPPTTDHGNVGNPKWPFSLSPNRLQTGGWARQQNIDQLPLATKMASVDMRLLPGAIRELHWHTAAEWAYVLKGSTVVTAVDTDGRTFVDKVEQGDLWYFPPGIPHSLQATNDDPEGTEFLLVFDNGDFNEDGTLLLTDWTAHIPKEVLSKNFGTNIKAFDHIPSEELYIFPAPVPPPDEKAPEGKAGLVPRPFTYKLSKAPATPLAGGSIKIFDPSVFAVATTIVGAIVTVEPGAMRELHWHPTQPEWDFFITGTARMTIFAGQSNAGTFDYQAGDIGYVPPAQGHYIENTGNTTLVYLELFNSDRVQDISLRQWLALTPPELVKAHLDLPDDVIANLNTTKQTVVAPYYPS